MHHHFGGDLRAAGLAVVLVCCADAGPVGGADVPDVAEPVSAEDVRAPEEASPTQDVPAPDVPVPAVTGLGGPCETDADCEEGWCADTPAGALCTTSCNGDCPPGLRCEVVVAGGLEQLCLPAFPRLCRPCDGNGDCAPPGLAFGQRCVSHGESGSFCGGDCATLPCPVGFVCELRRDVSGDETPQCVSLTGECGCTPDAVADAAMTTCYRETGAGRCEGVRECTSEGLGPCDAATPAAETCDGVDQDCDGQVDEDLGTEPCVATSDAGTCAGASSCVEGAWLCQAPEPEAESCDGADNDCDGETDEEGAAGCTPRYEDMDGDGYGTGAPRCLCGAGGAPVGGDCDDEDPAVRPGVPEVCNGKDDDCAGGVDEPGAAGCVALGLDTDGDGYGALGVESCRCAESGAWKAVPGGDCNDTAASIHPGAVEVCNGKDDDCDGVADPPDSDGCSAWLRDDDGDGVGVDDPRCLCAPAPPYTATVAGDCDDTSAAVKPGQMELCNGVDDDCDGLEDPPGAVGCTPWLKDVDGDGYGVSGESTCLCEPTPPYTAFVGGDCNDQSALVVPGQIEACNGLDDDCDSETDEAGAIGCAVLYADADGDGAGSLLDSRCLCAPEPPYVATLPGDCDDGDPEVLPGAPEICNGKDDDCDVAIDEVGSIGCSARYEDGDGDGWGTPKFLCLCVPEGDYTAVQFGDCDDDDPTIAPNRPELCNGVDDDCDGALDEGSPIGCSPWFADADGDGFGDPATAACLCGPGETETVSIAGDCDDSDPSRAPGKPESCTGVDSDCDGVVDEGCGMPVLGWPTAGADVRRSGQASLEQGPAGATVKWAVTLAGPVVGSPVVLPDKSVYAATAGTLARVAPNGVLHWELPVPPVAGAAGPTARLGGTVVLGATDTVLLVSPAGEVLWQAPMASPPVEAPPVVDAVGRIYVLSRGAAARFDATGAADWVVALPDGVTSVGPPAINTNGSLVFATADGAVRALDPDSGAPLWTFTSSAPSSTGALALGATGIVYFGTSQGVTAVTLTGAPFAAWATAPGPSGLGVFNTAYQCCIPSDQLMASTTAGVAKRTANLATQVWLKGPATSLPSATDYDGDTWVTGTNGALVCLDVSGNQKWSYKPATASITTPPAVGAGLVIAGDSAGVLRGLGD
ncbi:MAG: hypothetical protein AMXMBFR64_30840 [Myxococcales bacterium]